MSLLSLEQINQLDQPAFMAALGGLYEHSPWVAEETWSHRPFPTYEHLLHELNETLRRAGRQRQLQVIRAHPDLAGRLLAAGSLTASSRQEQAHAGLNSLSPEEAERFQSYNDRYRARFDFPFIICARLNNRSQILEAFEQRLPHSTEEEIENALGEIKKIAALRLAQLIDTP